MGLFSRRIKDPVRASAFVVAASGKPSGASSAPCRMNLVVTGPGHTGTAVETTVRAHYTRWPAAGLTLPVEVARDDITRIRVLWDEIPTARERGAAAAAAMASTLTGDADGSEPSPASDPSAPSGHVVRSTSITLHGHAATADEIARFETLTGLDLNGDGLAGRPPDDRLAALERLAALHTSGALTDEEFAAEKRRILGR